MATYTGTNEFSFTNPTYPSPGYDKCVSLILNNEDTHDITVNPQGKGGLASFAFTASPLDTDYQYCNAFLLSKLVEVPDRAAAAVAAERDEEIPTTKEVHLFLVSTRTISKDEPVVWWYGPEFFLSLKQQMGDKYPKWMNVKEIYKYCRKHCKHPHSNYRARTNRTVPKKKVGRPRKKTKSPTRSKSTSDRAAKRHKQH